MTVTVSPAGEIRLRRALKTIRHNLAYWSQQHWVDSRPDSPKTEYSILPPQARPAFIALEPMLDGAGIPIPDQICTTTLCLAGFLAFDYDRDLEVTDEHLIEQRAMEALGIADSEVAQYEFRHNVFYFTHATETHVYQRELWVEDWARETGRTDILEDEEAIYALASHWDSLRGFDETPERALENFTLFVGQVSETTGLDLTDVLKEVAL